MNKKYIVITFFIVLLLAVAFTWHKKQKPMSGQKQSTQYIAPTSTIPAHTITTGDGSYTMPTSISGQMKFVSPKLGTSFLYSGDVVPKEEGPKVYLANAHPYSGYDYHKDAQFVELF